MSPAKHTEVERIAAFWAKVDVRGPDDCWEWAGKTRHRLGYGLFAIGKGRVYAHRMAYELAVGPISKELELDHTCRNRACANVRHLEAVTHRENVLRGVSFAARNAVKTHCPRGHEYTAANTWRNKTGRRWCRACWKRAKELPVG